MGEGESEGGRVREGGGRRGGRESEVGRVGEGESEEGKVRGRREWEGE